MKKAIFLLIFCFGSSQIFSQSVVGPFCFKGFYFGANLGVSSLLAFRTDLDDAFLFGVPTSYSLNSTNLTGGAQMGYDWQYKYRIAGLVFDCNITDNREKALPATSGGTIFREHTSSMHWLATVRTKLGMTFRSSVAYTTFGAAFSSNHARWHRIDSSILPVTHFDHCTRLGRAGWTAGAGIEWKACGCWTVGGEFLYVNFTSRTIAHVEAGVRNRFNHEDELYLARILINYRFGDLRYP